MQNLGLVHLYTGLGKGKTTAAVGLGIRACGRGDKVVFAQFLKGQDSGERRILESMHLFNVLPVPETVPFVFSMTDDEKAAFAIDEKALFEKAIKEAENADVLILDEILGAIEAGMIEEKNVIAYLENRPQSLEVVLTGRKASENIKKHADYVMRIESEKHPYERNVPAREGIEY